MAQVIDAEGVMSALKPEPTPFELWKAVLAGNIDQALTSINKCEDADRLFPHTRVGMFLCAYFGFTPGTVNYRPRVEIQVYGALQMYGTWRTRLVELRCVRLLMPCGPPMHACPLGAHCRQKPQRQKPQKPVGKVPYHVSRAPTPAHVLHDEKNCV